MLAQAITAGVGGIGAAMSAYSRAKQAIEQKRIQEEFTTKAAADLARATEANANLSPAATAQRSRQDVNATMSGAIGAAANAAAGQSASSGDFGNAQGNAAAMTQSTMAAASPYAQQLAGINQSQYQAQADKVMQAKELADSTGQLSNQINYIMKDKENINPLGDALVAGIGGMLGGANTGGILGGLLSTKNKEGGLDAEPASTQAPPPAQGASFNQGFMPFNMAQALIKGYSPINTVLNRMGSRKQTM